MNSVIHELTLTLAPFIAQYGAISVFVVSVVEEIVVPIPSAFILLAAGFFLVPASAGLPEAIAEIILKVAVPGGLGLALGSMFVYALAYLGGEPAIKAWGRFLRVSWADVERFKARFTSSWWDEVTIFGFRAVPIFPHVLVSAALGAIRYPPREFFFLTLAGSAARAFIVGFIGWWLGAAYLEYSDSLAAATSKVAIGVGALAGVGLIFWIVRVIKNRRE